MRGSCLIPSVLYNSIDSGTRSVSNLYKLLLKSVVKSFGRSSDSCKQLLNLSASAVISGTCIFSLISGSSFTCLSNSAS